MQQTIANLEKQATLMLAGLPALDVAAAVRLHERLTEYATVAADAGLHAEAHRLRTLAERLLIAVQEL